MKLTDRNSFSGTLAAGDLVHVVDVSDTSQDPAGSSYKLTLSQLKSFMSSIISGSASFTVSGVSQSTFTVSIGSTQSGTGYKVFVTATNSAAAASFYVTNKTTTTFDIVYLVARTSNITLDWMITN